jgi:hypothetical protein
MPLVSALQPSRILPEEFVKLKLDSTVNDRPVNGDARDGRQLKTTLCYAFCYAGQSWDSPLYRVSISVAYLGTFSA